MTPQPIRQSDVLDYLAGLLPAARAEQVRQYLAAHPEALDEFNQLQDTWDALGQWPQSEPKSKPDFLLGVMKRIHEDQRSSRKMLPFVVRQLGRMAAMWIIAISVGVCVASSVFEWKTPELTADTQAVAPISPAEAEQELIEVLSLDALGQDEVGIAALWEAGAMPEEVEQ